ncbi:UNVERIFIED_CONTAM: hypothetical protein FKN15_039237 [Acipenser sinensis]
MALNLEDYFRTVYEDKLLIKMPEREDEYLTPATQLLEKRREMSEVEQALAAQKEMPEREDEYLTPATQLLEKRREMSEVEQALAAQKEEFQMKMESLQQRREELERKEEQLKESLLKFNKFLKENDSKRSRAVKKACDAREMARQKDRDMERLGEEIAVLEAKKERLQRKVEKNAIFWKYLEKVSKKSEKEKATHLDPFLHLAVDISMLSYLLKGPILDEIREMIGRFDTLISTREQLLRKASDNQEKLESQRLELHHFTEDKSTQESKWNHIQNTAAKKTLLLGQIKMASLNLLQLVNKQAGEQEAEIPIEDTDGQLNRESKWNHIQNTAAKKTLLLGQIKMASLNLLQLVNKQAGEQEAEIPIEDTDGQLNRVRAEIASFFLLPKTLRIQCRASFLRHSGFSAELASSDTQDSVQS